jgi:ferritin-like metal-binding protein YciE
MALFSQEFNSLDDLFLEQIQDLYDAEHRIIRALPKMSETAQDPELKRALDTHLAETRQHVERLNAIFRSIGQEPERKTCDAMKGLLSEGEDMVSAKGNRDVRDAAIIAAAQRVEHYEIAGYGTARTLAQHLGHPDAAQLLQQTLDEEKKANQILTDVAESTVNMHASR